MATDIATVEELNQFAQDNDKFVLDFWAPWCGPCRVLGKTLEQLESERDDFVVVKVNVDEAQDLAVENSIRSVPTIQFYKNGSKVVENSGAMPKSLLEKSYDEL